MTRSRVAILFFLRNNYDVSCIRARWSKEGCMLKVGSDPTLVVWLAEVRAEGSRQVSSHLPSWLTS